MTNILEKICTDKREHIARKKQDTSESELLQTLKDAPAPRGFRDALLKQKAVGAPALITELKKASPSKGLIRSNFSPQEIAKGYQAGGATCLSVLTDEPYFQGHDIYLKQAKDAVDIPVLRKDFMIDSYQIIESRALGADCILLIMAALEDELAKDLYQAAYDLKMDVLVEVHDAKELERAFIFSPNMVGINSRNLKTLEVNLDITFKLLKDIPVTSIRVAESGIYTNEILLSLQQAGADAFLVGEHLMRQENLTHATQTLLGTN